ncbi:hypothetical protein KSF_042700 [Reticulibacter mediterranei]|uniref:Uncharacterized protein n=1 Tax=Reticulibacter mediterranei TaxID=2778369 RepID=A0A8J3N1J4_9CHLR|nr:hypothetical protein KSF_042700 [Reticulibacter mediterranei]
MQSHNYLRISRAKVSTSAIPDNIYVEIDVIQGEDIKYCTFLLWHIAQNGGGNGGAKYAVSVPVL